MFLIPALYIGGAELVVSNLARFLRDRGGEVAIAHLKGQGPLGERLSEEGFDVVDLGAAGGGAQAYAAPARLRRALRERGSRILHSHGTAALVDASLCRLAAPDVRHVHTFHFGNYPNISATRRAMEHVFSRVPDRLVAVGHEQRRTIRSLYRLPDARITTVYNGVDPAPARVDPEIEALRKSGRVVIGSVSTLIEQKGIPDLLRTAAALRRRRDDFVFAIVGDGPLRGELEALARDLDLGSHVVFLGWVREAAARALPGFDIFFQSSLWEAMSMVVLEALAAGVPVVATRVGENGVVVRDGVNGRLCAPRDVDAMTSALESLVSSADRRRRMGRAARADHAERYTSEVMGYRHVDLYRELLST